MDSAVTIFKENNPALFPNMSIANNTGKSKTEALYIPPRNGGFRG
jgi:hypothetical protein